MNLGLIVRSAWPTIALGFAAACGSPVEPPVTPPPPPAPPSAPRFVLSNPVPSAQLHAAGLSAADAASEVTYISLPPGTVPSGVAAAIYNRSRSTRTEVYLFGGGFDPVAVPAAAGETIELDVRAAGGERLLSGTATVPATVRPIVVRTNPPPRKRDVPLNATFVIVFSEPMNPQTLANGTVQLTGSAGAVSGSLQIDSNGNRAEFIPAAPLAPNADYTLVVSSSAADLSGDRLEAALQVPITTTASVSAEISRIAFSDCSVAQCALFVMNADGSGVQQLTTGSARYPAWSPDGRKLAYFSVLSCALGGSCLDEIYVVNADGSDPVRLTHVTDQGSAAYLGSWSPDGQKIVFAIHERNSSGMTTRGRLYTMNPDGSGITQLTSADGYLDSQPAWSPDGARIAFVSTRDGGIPALYIMNADGSNQTRLTSGGFDILPRWAPDGSRLLFSRAAGVGSFYQLYFIDPDGSNLLALTTGPSGFSTGTWSPDGSRIAAVRSGSSVGLVTMSPTPGAAIQELRPGSLEGPAWSPFGFVPAGAGPASPALPRRP